MFALLSNLYKYVRSKMERRVCLIVLGVDNAGKTTLLNSLRGDLEVEATPTFGFNSTSTTSKALGLKGRQLSLQVFDLGGGKNIRRVWRSYLAEVHAVVFVVDAADSSRFEECQQVLTDTLAQPHLHGKPILVFANKQDLPGAAAAAEVAQHLGLVKLTHNAYHILGCTAKTASGAIPDTRLQQGLNWLLQTVEDAYSVLHPRVKHDTHLARQEEIRKKAERDERARKAREERLRKQAEQETQQQQHQHVEQANVLSSLPGAIESPKPGNAWQAMPTAVAAPLDIAMGSAAQATTITIRPCNTVPQNCSSLSEASTSVQAEDTGGWATLDAQGHARQQLSSTGSQLAARAPSSTGCRNSGSRPNSSRGKQSAPSSLQVPWSSLREGPPLDLPSPPLPPNLPSALPGIPPATYMPDGSFRVRAAAAAAGKLEHGSVARSSSHKSLTGRHNSASLDGSSKAAVGSNRVVPVIGGGM